MRYVLFLFVLVACNQPPIINKLKECDRVEIVFINNNGETDKVVATSEKTAINKLINYLNAPSAGTNKCNHDGIIIFFSSGKELQQVHFKKSSKDCLQFSYVLDQKLVYTKMTYEAADFLNALQQERKYY